MNTSLSKVLQEDPSCQLATVLRRYIRKVGVDKIELALASPSIPEIVTLQKGKSMFISLQKGKSMFISLQKGKSMFISLQKGKSMFFTLQKGKSMLVTVQKIESFFGNNKIRVFSS